MSLTSAYQAFLASPSATYLNADASLNYITTLTTINKSAAIAKYLSQQQTIVKKKQEKVLSTIEGGNAICLDVETTLEFKTGGGAYLPGLDDNFLTDHVVTFPIVHIVHFDNEGRIQQIRLYWDQGSLLKMVDVIGSRSRNWPIHDGQDQARLVASSVAHILGAGNVMATTTKQMGDVTITSRPSSPRKNPNNVTGDPHASLSLFGPRDDSRDDTYADKAIAPRASAKPQPRDYHDLFVGADTGLKERVPSPSKENMGASKYGAGKNFQPSRIFDTQDPEPTKTSPVKVHPTKYNHFEFADSNSDDTRQPSKPRPKTKHQSQWDFSDFTTPEKLPQRHRPQDVRQFGFGEEEDKIESHTKASKPIQPRRDAETHFEFKDDGAPIGNRPVGHPRGQGAKNGLSLYKNRLHEEESGEEPEKKSHPLSSVTSIKDRNKTFGPQFSMTDSSPGLGEKTASDTNRPIPENRMKAVRMMDAQWEATDASPGAPSSDSTTAAKNLDPISPSKNPSLDKENVGFGRERTHTGIKTDGDGMGSRKENVGFGKERANMGIKTGGDGMGGRKGAASTWGFGDETDEFGAAGGQADKFMAGKKQQAPKDNSFWDF